jgi:hypothetical protein
VLKGTVSAKVGIDKRNVIFITHLHIQCTTTYKQIPPIVLDIRSIYRLCGQLVRVSGYKFRGPGSILGATTFSEE